jgi:transposase
MSKQIWLGVDLGKKHFEAALAMGVYEPKRWAQLPSQRFENTREGLDALCRWVEVHTEVYPLAGACVESTGPLAWRFVAGLAGRLGPVSLVNPRFISDYAKSLGLRDKTDRIDACVMAL